MKKAFQALRQSWDLLKDNPLLTSPFILLALAEGITLYLLFLAPQEPFSKLLAPPIARFFGEQFVHYPGHLLKLPTLFYFAKIVLSFLPGMFLSAFFVGLIGDIKLDRTTSLRRHIKAPIRRFFALFIIWGLGTSFFIIWLPYLGFLKPLEMLYIEAISWGDSKGYLIFLEFLVFVLSFWIQILFLYALPLVILAEQSLFKALIGNFRYLRHLFLPTTVCLFMAALLYAGFYFFERDTIGLAVRNSPEIIVVITAIGIPITMIINLLVTTTSTLLFIDEQKTDPKISLVTGKEASS